MIFGFLGTQSFDFISNDPNDGIKLSFYQNSNLGAYKTKVFYFGNIRIVQGTKYVETQKTIVSYENECFNYGDLAVTTDHD